MEPAGAAPALVVEPSTVLFRGYDPGVTERRPLRLVNPGKAPIAVSVHEEATNASATARLSTSLFRVVGMPRQPAELILAPNGGSQTLQVEFAAPRASSKAPRAHSHTIVFEVVGGGADVAVPVRATPAPPQLFEAPPPRVLDFGRVPLGSAPRRQYRFRCVQGGTHKWKLFVSPPASDATHDFAFSPTEGTLTRGDALQLTVAFGAATAGASRCKLDIVATSVGDGQQTTIRRFSFDIAGFAVDPNALPPQAQQQQDQKQPQQPPPAITGQVRQQHKAKKRVPKDQKVLALEAAFRRDMTDFEEQLAQRQVRTARTPGYDPVSPRHTAEIIASERSNWDSTLHPPGESFTTMGRPLLRRPTDPLPRPPPGIVEAEMAGAPVQSRREQSMWRFRLAARAIVLRVRAQHRIAMLHEFLGSVGFDRDRVAAAVASLLPPPRRAAASSAAQNSASGGTVVAAASLSDVLPLPATASFLFSGLPRSDEAPQATEAHHAAEPTTSLLSLTCMFDPYEPVDLLPVADARTERFVREAAAWVAGTRSPTYWWPPPFTDVQLRSATAFEEEPHHPQPPQPPQQQQSAPTAQQQQGKKSSVGTLPPVSAEKKDP